MLQRLRLPGRPPDTRGHPELWQGFVMISGISAATSGLTSASARFERAAASIASSPELSSDTTSTAAPPTDLVGAQVEMMTAKLAFSASIIALRASTEMVAEAIDLGGYGTPATA
jgi:hypothetical protein